MRNSLISRIKFSLYCDNITNIKSVFMPGVNRAFLINAHRYE